MSIFVWTQSHWIGILLVPVFINQLLNDIPSLKANHIFTLYRDFVKDEAKKAKPDIEKILNDDAR